MVELRGHLDLALESFDAHLGGELGRQDLHDHLPAERGVDSGEYARHAGAWQFSLDAERRSQCRFELLSQVQ